MLITAIDAHKIPISSTGMSLEEILAVMDSLDERRQDPQTAMAERVRSILDRLGKSGNYAHITYDPHAEVYVLVKRDGARTALSPVQLDALFNPAITRPQRPTLNVVR